MVGQKSILNNVEYWVETDTVPRFIIISGSKGHGKTTLSKEIARRMKAYLIECELSVDAVREAVKNCYKCSGPTVYLFRDADKMSTAAKNAMLKITEEPPRQAHFIVTVQNSDNMLETLRSRATNIQMVPYSREELDTFYHEHTSQKSDTIREFSHTPGMMLELEKIDCESLIEFCHMVVDNIAKVTGVNAFKIGQRIKVKETGEGWDADLFFYFMSEVLLHRALEASSANSWQEALTYSDMLQVTCKYRHEMHMTGVKKESTLDMWILEMREC